MDRLPPKSTSTPATPPVDRLSASLRWPPSAPAIASANGQLTLKGVTNLVSMDFTLEDTGSGTTAHFSGMFELERLQFGVGEGFWSDTSWTSNEVTVTVKLDLEQ